jgi:peptide deformylase
MVFKAGKIVAVEDIPEIVNDVPLGDLMEVYKVCTQMAGLCDTHNGIGLSAVQVGIPWNLFLVKSDGTSPFGKKGDYGFYLNCEYREIGEEKSASLEGCLSLTNGEQPRMFGLMRWNEIQLKGLRLTDDQELKIEEIDLKLDAHQQGVVFQHEIDHQEGILISDIGKELFVW